VRIVVWVSIAVAVGVAILAVVVFEMLSRWQASIDRRERGEDPRGFPVEPADRNHPD
jgi:hypothetical protein